LQNSFPQITPRQNDLYQSIIIDSKKEKVEQKTLRNIFMQLRKAANHHCLFRNYYKEDTLKKMSREITQVFFSFISFFNSFLIFLFLSNFLIL